MSQLAQALSPASSFRRDAARGFQIDDWFGLATCVSYVLIAVGAAAVTVFA